MKKFIKVLSKVVLVTSLGVIALISWLLYEPTPPLPNPTTAEQCVNPGYSMAGGVMYTAERLLKQNLNDPSSYQRTDWHFAGTRVVINYRAKNGFGGLVAGTSISDVTYNGTDCQVELIQ